MALHLAILLAILAYAADLTSFDCSLVSRDRVGLAASQVSFRREYPAAERFLLNAFISRRVARAQCLQLDSVPAPHPTFVQLAVIAAISALGGGVNSIAGGGTLLTFPALLGLGIPGIVANATSTVALWPGSFGSMMGYRKELLGARHWAVRLAIPSILGGLSGAYLLMATSEERFKALVPFLVLGATVLFAIQKPVAQAINRRLERLGVDTERAIHPGFGMLLMQFAVAVYGGYFGAGAGILMLAAFGFMGFTNIHQMNGLKNFNGIFFNGVAAVTFAVQGLVNWPIALVMAAGSAIGGFVTAGVAQRIPQAWVRNAVTVIGLGSAGWLFWTRR